MKNQSRIEAHKSRNNAGFAYSDAEINAVNLARNNKENYKYFTIKEPSPSTRTKETGILIDKNDQPVRNADGGIEIVIELPACAVDQGSPIGPRLQEQLKHLEEFKKTHSDKEIYPIKILFPYKLQAWHWNVGEIIVNNSNNKIAISGCAYDSMKKTKSLEAGEAGITGEIEQAFKDHYKNNAISFTFKESEEIEIVQPNGSVACGLYAGIAMHNLKTKKVENIWDGIFNGDNNTNKQSEQELRNIDSDLITAHHPNPENFCKPDANISSTRKEAAIKLDAALREAIKSLSLIDDTNKNKLITHLNTFNSSEEEPKEKLNKLFKNLEGDNEAKNIIFTLNEKGEREKLKIATEILALLPKELKLSISSDNKNSTNTENENIFSACIQLIDNSFRSEIYKIAIKSAKKIEDGFLDKANPTLAEQSIKYYHESVLSSINEIKEKEDKTLLIDFLAFTLNETIKQVNEEKELKEKELKEKSNQQKPQSNNQIIIKSDDRPLHYQGFEVVICDKNSQVTAQLSEQNGSQEINSLLIPDIKQDIDYAFCKQNQQNNTNPASHNFGFRFNSEAGELINAVNKEGASDAEKNTAWEELLKNHDTVIFKLALDGQNYIRFYLNRDKDRKIEFASDEFLFSKEDALKLSKDLAQYDKIKRESEKAAIDKDERFDIHLYCKSGPKETDKDKEILNYPFNSNEQTQHIITDMNGEKSSKITDYLGLAKIS